MSTDQKTISVNIDDRAWIEMAKAVDAISQKKPIKVFINPMDPIITDLSVELSSADRCGFPKDPDLSPEEQFDKYFSGIMDELLNIVMTTESGAVAIANMVNHLEEYIGDDATKLRKALMVVCVTTHELIVHKAVMSKFEKITTKTGSSGEGTMDTLKEMLTQMRKKKADESNIENGENNSNGSEKNSITIKPQSWNKKKEEKED